MAPLGAMPPLHFLAWVICAPYFAFLLGPLLSKRDPCLWEEGGWDWMLPLRRLPFPGVSLHGSHVQPLWWLSLVLPREAGAMPWTVLACGVEVSLRRQMRMYENSIWQKLMEKNASLLIKRLLHFKGIYEQIKCIYNWRKSLPCTCHVPLPTFQQSSHLLAFQHFFSLKYKLYFSNIISIHAVEMKLMAVLISQISSESLKFALDYSNHLASLYIFTQVLLMFKQIRLRWDVQGEIYTPKKRNVLFSQTTSSTRSFQIKQWVSAFGTWGNDCKTGKMEGWALLSAADSRDRVGLGSCK